MVDELTQEAIAYLNPFPGKEYLCGLAHVLAGRTK